MKNLFTNAQLGEYFRVFISYGVIALSLAMHAWQLVKRDQEVTPEDGETLEGGLESNIEVPTI